MWIWISNLETADAANRNLWGEHPNLNQILRLISGSCKKLNDQIYTELLRNVRTLFSDSEVKTNGAKLHQLIDKSPMH
jgi:hypothetical protein